MASPFDTPTPNPTEAAATPEVVVESPADTAVEAAPQEEQPKKKKRKKPAESALMIGLRRAFTPNAPVSPTLGRSITFMTVGLLLLVWTVGDFKALPTPSGLLQAFVDLFTKHTLLLDLWTSLKLNVQAISLATFFSLLFAYAFSFPAFRPFVLLLTKLRFLSLLGITFIFQMYLGGHWLKVWLLTFGMTTFFLTSTAAVVAEISQEQWEDAATLRMKPMRAMLEIAVFGTFDKMLEALRQNAAIAWVMLTTVEGMIRSEGGIGTLLLNENKHFRLDAVFAIQITILAVGLLQDYALGWLRASLPWVQGKGK